MRNIKIHILLGWMLAAFYAAWASPVDSATAKMVATRFYQMKTHSDLAGLYPEKVYTYCAPNAENARTLPVFFIYNMADGYVIVSADNRITPVIAYSTEGPFDVEQVLPALTDFLDDYATEIGTYLRNTPDLAGQEHPLWRQIVEQHPQMVRNEVVVPPLLSTLWDQNSYYNDLCPSDAEGPGGHAYAGCVATAMAQVIRYWSFPTQGTGSHSYVSDYDVESADFGATTYNYSLMPDKLTSATPAAQRQAVAQLIYHCGVSVDMNYGNDGSSASTSNAPYALTTYFGYTSNPSYKSKNNYSTTNWVNMIKGQLNNLRPVIYRGQGDGGGHSFVCDGYDDLNYFHFNWGWSGSNNGYFLLSDLTPGSHDFTTSQGAVINVFVDRTMLRIGSQQMSLYSVNGSADTAQVRVISVNGGQHVTATASGNFTISNGIDPFADTAVLSSGNQMLYVRYQAATTAQQTHYGTIALTYDSLTATVTLRGDAIPVEHNAPQNPNAVYSAPAVHLTWTPPAFSQQSFTHGESSHGSNYGYSSDYARTLLYRLCDTDLVAFYPAQMTHVSFYLRSDVTYCKLVVYKGGSYDGQSLNPGTLALEQPLNLNQLNTSAWNMVALQTPVPISLGEELWYGIYIEAPGGSYTIPVGNTNSYEPEKGDVVCRHYASGSSSWSFFNADRNFSLRAQFQTLPPVLDHYLITRDTLIIGTTTNNYYDDVVTHSGNYTYHIAAVYVDNAAAEVTTDVVVQVVAHVDTITAQICSGDVYPFHGQQATDPGNYFYYAHDTLTVLQLSVNPASYTDLTAETCNTYSWNGVTYNVSGDYSVTLANSLGCDSVITLHLTVHPHPELYLAVSNDVLYYPETATLTAYGADYYFWSTGQASAQIEVCPTIPTWYKVTASMYNSPCTAVDSVFIYTHGYGIEDHAAVNLRCYPNPVSDVLHVSGDPVDQLMLYDMQGRLCRTWKGRRDEWRLSLRHLPNGNYLLVGADKETWLFVNPIVVKH